MKLLLIFLLLPFLSYSVYQTITHPGRYKLGDNLVFNPIVDNDIAIVIAASDVFLDLNDYQIIQAAGNGHSSIHGIYVSPNLHNITIKNGLISNLTGTGIAIQEGCKRIFIENIQTYSCDLSGIECTGTASNPIHTLIMDNCWTFSCCQLAHGFLVGGIHFIECQESEMRNCQANNNLNVSNTVAGILLESCERCTFINNTAKNNIGNSSVAGFAIFNGQDNYFYGCNSIGNSVMSIAPAFVFGYIGVGQEFARTTFNKCVSAQNNGGLATGGFFMQGPAADISLIDCHSLQNSGTNVAYGFIIDSITRVNFIDCIAKGNVTDPIVSTTSSGFVLSNAIDSLIYNCFSAEQRSETALGFELNSCTNLKVQDSKAYVNVGVSDAFSYGFALNFDSGSPDFGNNIFINNVAGNNGALPDHQMNNFIAGSFNNISYSLLSTITAPFINVGLVP